MICRWRSIEPSVAGNSATDPGDLPAAAGPGCRAAVGHLVVPKKKCLFLTDDRSVKVPWVEVTALEQHEDEHDQGDDQHGSGQEKSVLVAICPGGVEDRPPGRLYMSWSTGPPRAACEVVPRPEEDPGCRGRGQRQPRSGRMIRAKIRSSPAPSIAGSSPAARPRSSAMVLPHHEHAQRRGPERQDQRRSIIGSRLRFEPDQLTFV